MQLTSFESDAGSVHAGYACPCGCTPSVTHQRGGDLARDVCCCGNEFAVGPDAERSLTARDGFRLETEPRVAAWGEPVMAAWLVGPSVHPEPADDGGAHDHGHHHDDGSAAVDLVDPVCGMSVVPAVAVEKGLHRKHDGADYYYCGKGCYLEFGDDPEHYLDPSYVPSM
jgi:YHS domain-containing protein